MFSPLGGRKVTYSSRIKRLLKDLEGERNRFRSQFQTQIQGLLTSFEEEQSHTKTVIILFPFSSWIEAHFQHSAILSIGICLCIASNSRVETTLSLSAAPVQFTHRYADHPSSLLRREHWEEKPVQPPIPWTKVCDQLVFSCLFQQTFLLFILRDSTIIPEPSTMTYTLSMILSSSESTRFCLPAIMPPGIRRTHSIEIITITPEHDVT